MIFTQRSPRAHHLPAAEPIHYAPLYSSPLAPQTPRQMSNLSVGQPIHFSFSPPRHGDHAAPPFTSSQEASLAQSPWPALSSSASSRSKSSPTFADRYASTVANPLASASKSRSYSPSSSSPSARDKRRHAFLNRVRADRDAGRLEDRMDRFMYLEHAAEQKEWKTRMERSAKRAMEGFTLGGHEVETDRMEAEIFFDDGMSNDCDSRALEEYLAAEQITEQDLMVVYREQDHNSVHVHNDQTQSVDFGSLNDEEYDRLFLHLAEQSQGQGMDMTAG